MQRDRDDVQRGGIRAPDRRGFLLIMTGALVVSVGVLLPTLSRAATARSVIVFGGTGQLGSEIVKALSADGHRVTVFARPSSKRDRLGKLPVKVIEGDVLVDADVERAMKAQRFDLVVDALGRSESDVSFYATSGTNIAKWAKATGVKQIIHHSSVGVGNSRAAYPPDQLTRMSRLFEAKNVGEQAAVTSGIPYTIIRNAVLRDLNPGATDRAQRFEDPMKFGVVSRVGLARLTRECIDNSACKDKIFHGVDPSMTM